MGVTPSLNRRFTLRTFHPRWATLLLLASVVLGLSIQSAAVGLALAETDTEGAIKAAILYNFTKVIRWPHETPLDAQRDTTHFILGVVGGGSADIPFESIAGKRVGTKPVEVRQVDEPQDLLSCQMLFISPSSDKELEAILEQLQGSDILTVSEINDFAKRGGMIELTRRRNRIRFLINVTAAEQANLNISSQLLKIAEIVTGERS
jgi:hypothetical protein